MTEKLKKVGFLKKKVTFKRTYFLLENNILAMIFGKRINAQKYNEAGLVDDFSSKWYNHSKIDIYCILASELIIYEIWVGDEWCGFKLEHIDLLKNKPRGVEYDIIRYYFTGAQIYNEYMHNYFDLDGNRMTEAELFDRHVDYYQSLMED